MPSCPSCVVGCAHAVVLTLRLCASLQATGTTAPPSACTVTRRAVGKSIAGRWHWYDCWKGCQHTKSTLFAEDTAGDERNGRRCHHRNLMPVSSMASPGINSACRSTHALTPRASVGQRDGSSPCEPLEELPALSAAPQGPCPQSLQPRMQASTTTIQPHSLRAGLQSGTCHSVHTCPTA